MEWRGDVGRVDQDGFSDGNRAAIESQMSIRCGAFQVEAGGG
jgi:hypothetical protein